METMDGATLIIAVAAAVVTGIAAVYSGWQASTAHAAVQLTRRIYEEQNQPYIFADVRPSEHQPELFVLMIKNQGPTVARDIHVTFDPPLIGWRTEQITIAKWGTTALTPGATVTRSLGVGWQFCKSNSAFCHVTVSAQGTYGPTTRLSYDLDFEALRQTPSSKRTTNHVVKELEKLNRTIEKLSDATHEIAQQDVNQPAEIYSIQD